MDLTNYVSENRLTSLLLMGSEGLAMREDGLALARHLLSVKNVEEHTDFLLVEPAEGKKSIGVDEVLPIIRMGTMPPVHSKHSVVLIDGMDKLTVPAQNKLLVLLESNPYVFVIGVAYEDKLLDTVKSRMRIIPYKKCTKAEFVSAVNMPADDAELFFYATAGCPGMVKELESEKEMFRSLKQLCSTKSDRNGLMKALHLLKEKDERAVSGDSRLMLCVIRILQFVFNERAVDAYREEDVDGAIENLEIVKRLISDEQICGKSTYSKDDFFNTIVFCMEH